MSGVSGINGTSGVNFGNILETSGGNVQLAFAMLQMELAQANKDQAQSKIDSIRASQATSKTYTETLNSLRPLKSYDAEAYGPLPTDQKAIEAEIKALNSAIADVQAHINPNTKNNVPLSAETMAYIDQHQTTGFFDFFRTSGAAMNANEFDKYSKRDNAHTQAELQGGLAALQTRLSALQSMQTALSTNPGVFANSGITLGASVDSSTIANWMSSIESTQNHIGADIQQEMVYVQDFMGQYNAYTQGATSAISSANETLKSVARG